MKKGVWVLSFLIVFITMLIFVNLLNSNIIDIGQKFNIHGRVIESGVYTIQNSTEIIENFEDIYFQKLKEGKKVYLVFGDKNEIDIVTYEDLAYGNVNLFIGNQNSELQVSAKRNILQRVTPRQNEVSFYISGKEYKINVKDDENVYFIIEEDI